MVHAIRRPDGTYRGWARNAPAGSLQPGEVWEERDTPPEIAEPPVVAAPVAEHVFAWALDHVNDLRATVGLPRLSDAAAEWERVKRKADHGKVRR